MHPIDATTPAGVPPVPDDRALVTRMASGDESALGALFDRWQPVVYALAVRIVGDRDEAEDVVEDAFWQIWRQARTYDTSRGSVATWILTVARSRALDRRRASKRRRTEPIEAARPRGIADDRAADPLTAADLARTRQVVVAALSELPPDQRQVVELAYFGGLSQTEIAETTNVPLGTIKTRARLAMQKLRDSLGAVWAERRAP